MMRCYLLLCLLFIPAIAQATVNYQLDLQLNPAEQKLTGKATLTGLPIATKEAKLRLAKNCKILAVQQAGQTTSYRFTNGQLLLELQSSDPVSISYQGQFNDQVATTPVHNEDPSYGVSATISPQGVYLSAGAEWYPQLATEDIHYQVNVSAPAGFEALTSGRRTEHLLTGDESYSSWEINYPLYGLTLAAGNYKIYVDETASVPIYAYFYEKSAQFAQLYLQEARNYLKLYEELFGPYPFHKFAIVENFFPTGYGFPSWTLLGSSVIKLPFIVKTSLGHEIAHSWWGTGVRVNYTQGNWAEGLTTYVADYLYKERRSDSEARDYRLKILRDYASLVDQATAFPINKFISRQNKASQAIGYGKVAMLFHMLRQQVGDKAFWQSLRTIAEEKMFQHVGWSELAEVFSTTSKANLQHFFETWLNRTEGPSIQLQQARTEKNMGGWRVTAIIRQEPPYYRLPVTLRLTTAEGQIESKVLSIQGRTSVQIQTVARPISLEADPEANLFRILEPMEIPATVNSIRGSNKLLVVKAGELEPTEEVITTLLGGLRKVNQKVKNLNEITENELVAHDLLIFGVTGRLKPEDLELSTSAGNISFAGEKINLAEQSAIIVQRNPFSEKQNACWVLSQNQQASVVARKIPHYGKYSFLLFEGTKNVSKRISTPNESPLRVEFWSE